MKRSWNVADAIAVSVICLLLASLLSMGIVRQRGAARSRSCENNLKQIGLAFHNYHSAFKQLPSGAGGTDSGSADKPLDGNAGRLSAFVGLTPFMEQQPLWAMISNPLRSGQDTFPPMGPVPWFDGYKPWSQRPTILVCPADDASQAYGLAASYVLNYGDGVNS